MHSILIDGGHIVEIVKIYSKIHILHRIFSNFCIVVENVKNVTVFHIFHKIDKIYVVNNVNNVKNVQMSDLTRRTVSVACFDNCASVMRHHF